MFIRKDTSLSLSFTTPIFLKNHLLFHRPNLQFVMPKRKKPNNSGSNSSKRPKRATPVASSAKKTKFYAIRTGRDRFKGVVTSWEECNLYVTGVSGAIYKSFKTYDEAVDFINVGSSSQTNNEVPPEANNNGDLDTLIRREIESTSTQQENTDRTCPDDQQVIIVDDQIEQVDLQEYGSRELEPSRLVVYTDGACINNGKKNARAGYGVYFGEDSPYNLSCRLPGRQTNQRAEVTAVLKAMELAVDRRLLARRGVLEIYTDSQYTKRGIEEWIDKWKKRKWKTTAGSDVLNKDLWVTIDKLKVELKREEIVLVIKWVKGHVGIPGNEAADRLAVNGIYEET